MSTKRSNLIFAAGGAIAGFVASTTIHRFFQKQPEQQVELEESLQDTSVFNNPMRALIRAWFKKKGADSLGDLYEGSVDMLYGKPVAGWSRTVPHCVREIRNRLPGIISGNDGSGRFPTDERVKAISKSWRKSGLPLERHSLAPTSDGTLNQVSVPKELFDEIQTLLVDYEAAQGGNKKAAERLYKSLAVENPSRYLLMAPIVENWIAITEWFVQRAHDGKQSDSDVNIVEFREQFEVFELALSSFAKDYYDTIDSIDPLLQTPERASELFALLVHPEQLRYFFENVTHPGWLKPLSSMDFFMSIPPLKNEAGEVEYQRWPQAFYLAKVANEAPEEVTKILLDLPNIDSAIIAEDLIEVVLSLPSNYAAKVTKKIVPLCKLESRFLLPSKIGQLCAKLATTGHVNESFVLAKELLRPKRIAIDVADESNYHFYRNGWYEDGHFVMSSADYEHFLDKDFPDLAKASPEKALSVLCDTLHDAMKLAGLIRDADSKTIQDDFGGLYRKHIEDSGVTQRSSIFDLLISTIRDLSNKLLAEGILDIDRIRNVFGRHRLNLFKRLEWHLLSCNPYLAQDAIRRLLLDQENFLDDTIEHSYLHLFLKAMDLLTDEEQSTVLHWIEEQPLDEKYIAWLTEHLKRSPTAEEVDIQRQIIQERKLALIKERLTTDWLSKLAHVQTVLKELGYSLSGTTTFVRSGFLDDRYVRESISTIVNDLMAAADQPSYETGSALSKAIEADPARFAQAAMSFNSVPTLYLGYLIWAIREGLIRGKVHSYWKPVLELVDAIVDRLSAETDSHCVVAIINLLSTGLESDKDYKIPFEFRSLVWSLIERLLAENAAEATVNESNEDAGADDEPFKSLKHDLHGDVVELVIKYAIWSREWSGAGFSGFDDIPEVQVEIEKILSQSGGASVATYSELGSWFLWLLALDLPWMTANLQNLFGSEAKYHIGQEAAWTGYLTNGEVKSHLFRFLEAYYRRAITNLSLGQQNRYADWEEQLAVHLLTFYFNGGLLLEDQLFQDFWNNASPPLRLKFLDIVGKWLPRHDRKKSPVEASRIQALWNHVTEWCADHADYLLLTSFGTWFAAGTLEPSWSNAQMIYVIEKTKKCSKESIIHSVFQQLEEDSAVIPDESIKVLHAVLRESAGLYPWFYQAREKNIRAILMAAIENGAPPAKNMANAIIDKLGKFGVDQFRDLRS
jgi:hypothetical protein